MDRDGKIDTAEVARSRKILMALKGDCDFNCDGKVDEGERKEAADARRTGLGFDKNGDGKLMQDELIEAGARLWGDKNCDGKIDAKEVRGTGCVGLDVLTGDVYFS